eukprot:10591768-Alexandrium_andersonii.AAC.1
MAMESQQTERDRAARCSHDEGRRHNIYNPRKAEAWGRARKLGGTAEEALEGLTVRPDLSGHPTCAGRMNRHDTLLASHWGALHADRRGQGRGPQVRHTGGPKGAP